MNDRFVRALRSKYQAKIDEAIATIDLYNTKSAGIGEHPDILSVLDEYVSILETNRSKLELLDRIFVLPTEEPVPQVSNK
tara:strand:+ start:892 stop:1131 length:240 start_codon:yes stop_codon:yes gene_type:complete